LNNQFDETETVLPDLAAVAGFAGNRVFRDGQHVELAVVALKFFLFPSGCRAV